MIVRDTVNALLAALIAPPCASCGRVLDRPLDGAVCNACWSAIAPRPTIFALPRVTRAQAIGEYDGVLRDVLHALKYDGRRSIARPLSVMMAGTASEVLAGAHFAVPVPLHWRRRRERGFNQAEDLARGLGLPVLRILTRVKVTRPQVELPTAQRRANVRTAFALRRRVWLPAAAGGSRFLPPPAATVVARKVLVLIDDVATTGATLEACATVLRAAGAAEVRALTAARAVTGPR